MRTRILQVLSGMLAFGLMALCLGPSANADSLSAAVPPGATRVADAELATLRGGALLSFLSALIGALPPGNTVQIQIGNQLSSTHSDTSPQSLTATLGGTTASGSAGINGTTTFTLSFHRP